MQANWAAKTAADQIQRPFHSRQPGVRNKKDRKRQIKKDAGDLLVSNRRRLSNHIQKLQQKADQYAMRLMSPKLTADNIRVFHRSIYIPSMQCSLPAIAVDEEALVPVQFKVIQVVFPRLHFNSEIPRSIRHHGPVQLVGLGLYNLCTEAGLEALKCFKSAIHSNFEVKNVLGINLQYTHME